MSWFSYFIIGCVIAALAGYYYGKKLLKDAERVSKKTFVESSTDSTIQAKIIGMAIKERATILGSRNLSWKFYDDYKNKYHTFYALDELRSNYGIHTQMFLLGVSSKLVKFIRLCHSFGCSIMLRQIGEKVDIQDKTEKDIYLSKPELEMFL